MKTTAPAAAYRLCAWPPKGPAPFVRIDRVLSHGLPCLLWNACLDCRGCETVCPSGVQYGRLIEPLRVAIRQASKKGDRTPFKGSCPLFPDWFREIFLFRLFPYPDRIAAAVRSATISPARGPFRFGQAHGIVENLPRPIGPHGFAFAAAASGKGRNCRNSSPPWDAGGPGWRFSPAAWPMPCSATCIGPRSGCCSKTAAISSSRPSKAAAGHCTSKPATAATHGKWPTPILWPSNWTATTPLW